MLGTNEIMQLFIGEEFWLWKSIFPLPLLNKLVRPVILGENVADLHLKKKEIIKLEASNKCRNYDMAPGVAAGAIAVTGFTQCGQTAILKALVGSKLVNCTSFIFLFVLPRESGLPGA